MYKFEHITIQLFVGGNCAPDMLVPACTGVPACTLVNLAVYDGMSDFPFAAVVGQFNIRFSQKAKVALDSITLESATYFLHQFMIRRMAISDKGPFKQLYFLKFANFLKYCEQLLFFKLKILNQTINF